MIAQLKNASKIYDSPTGKMTVLDDCTLEINLGELLLIIGPSGSGKTTLLSLLGCLINPTEGILEIDGKKTNTLSATEMAAIRLKTIGFVFQQFNLLAPLTAEGNIAFPLKMLGLKTPEIKKRTSEALSKVNMQDHRKKLPKQLSGGQQQRIAIARALVTDPKIILCDEPTASLDKDSIFIVMEELKQLAKSGKAVAVVTHDPRLASYADRAIEINNGKISVVKASDVMKH
ncbi:ABC transporter ATP-binding protein [Chitinophaga silvisoli]|uniref:ABC transporter ATP-binding protein n=1 Tax=Chitinophaga silvisoli TaxID=2291814 RepID=A0A3E1P018_9BACT|nr:ABC transporter ATP-binding protein [Chitinophaga silvisoli]RFM33519.1 ABC transporter ATP-binding protein [Chitinophaga silvisoli]